MGVIKLKNLPTAAKASATDSVILIQNGISRQATISAINEAEIFWCDIDFPIIPRTTGVGIPATATIQGNLTAPKWQVNDAIVCEVQELVHAWKEGSELYWHIHIITGGSNIDNRYIRFEIEYTLAGFGVTLPANTIITSADMLIPANTPALTHLIFTIGSFVPAETVHIAAHIKARLKRIAASGTAPTADIFCEMLQLHIQIDTPGSHAMVVK